MANQHLFYSSLCSWIIHQLIFFMIPMFPHRWIYDMCLLTSLWNHGTTSSIAKWMDRSCIGVCVLHNMYCVSHSSSLSPTGLFFTVHGVVFYFLSKTFVKQHQRNLCHVISHGCATISNIVVGLVFTNQFFS